MRALSEPRLAPIDVSFNFFFISDARAIGLLCNGSIERGRSTALDRRKKEEA